MVFNADTGVSVVQFISALNSGEAVIAGPYFSVNGYSDSGLARINANGARSGPLSNSVSYGIECVAQQPDGKLVVGGTFTQVTNGVRVRIARLKTNGLLDQTFDPGLGADGPVNAVAMGADNSIIIAGSFTKVGGVAQQGIARLRGDGVPAALPETPQWLAASVAGADSLTVSWADQLTEDGWKLERSQSGAGGWIEVAILPWDVTSYSDAGLAADTTYQYRLRATNLAGASGYSAIANAKTYSLYQQWKLDHSFALEAADDGDGDGDGLALLMEFALGTDPAAMSTSDLPVGQILGDVVALSYRRMHPELTYSVERSTDLQTWTTNGVFQGSGPFPIAFIFLDGAAQKFLRLRVTR